jgi:hypothetical protein
MRGEKKYIVTESQLMNLLIAEMKNAMNERAGVDNWEWCGNSYDEVINDYYPDDDVPEDTDVWECAKARIEAGEFPEEVNIQEFLGNIFVDESMN